MEYPAALARAQIESANVPRSGRAGAFARAAAEDQHILENNRRSGVKVALVRELAVEAQTHVQDAAVGELVHQPAAFGVEAVHIGACGGEYPPLFAVLPVGGAAVDALRPAHDHALVRVEIPEHLARCGVQSANLELRRGDVHPPVDDDGRAFDRRRRPLQGVARGMRPGNLQAADVRAVDLIERGIPRRFGEAAVPAPVIAGAARRRRVRRGSVSSGGRRQSGFLQKGAAGVTVGHGGLAPVLYTQRSAKTAVAARGRVNGCRGRGAGTERREQRKRSARHPLRPVRRACGFRRRLRPDESASRAPRLAGTPRRRPAG